jgi:hypothetical protein
MSATKKENARRGNNQERKRIEVSIEKSATLELRSEAASGLKLRGFYHVNVCGLHAGARLNEGTPEALLTRGVGFLGSQAVQRILRLGSSARRAKLGPKDRSQLLPCGRTICIARMSFTMALFRPPPFISVLCKVGTCNARFLTRTSGGAMTSARRGANQWLWILLAVFALLLTPRASV